MSKNYNIAQIKTLRKELNRELLKLIDTFEKDSDLTVSDVRIHHSRTMDGNVSLVSVETEIAI